MKKSIIAAALVAGMVGPVSAATVLDFTSSAINTPGGLSGPAAGTTYTITGSGTLTNSTHKTNVGCTGDGWDFACTKSGSKYDVGLGISGTNSNEVDGITVKEWVQVKFDKVVKVLGFAGMLAYNDSKSKGTETVVLWYSADSGATWASIAAAALDDDNDPGNVGDNKFDTVGLAYLKNLSLLANVVKFKAGGVHPYDDGNANVTAAGLEVAPIPVPASFPLLLAGIGALGWAARRKRKAA